MTRWGEGQEAGGRSCSSSTCNVNRKISSRREQVPQVASLVDQLTKQLVDPVLGAKEVKEAKGGTKKADGVGKEQIGGITDPLMVRT